MNDNALSLHLDAAEIVFDTWQPEEEAARESLLGLGNGLLFARAAAPESAGGFASPDGVHYPGLYRAGGYDAVVRPIDGEETINTALARLPDPFGLAVAIGQAPWFGPGDSERSAYRHALDLDAGITRREMLFRCSNGCELRLTEIRLVSMAHPQLIGLRWILTAQRQAGTRLRLRSAMTLQAANTKLLRNRAYEGTHWRAVRGRVLPPELTTLLADSIDGCTRIAIGARTCLRGAAATVSSGSTEAGPHLDLELVLEAGQTVTVEKIIAVVCREEADGDVQTAAAEAARQAPDFSTLEGEHREAWASLWTRSWIRAGSHRLERTARFHAFHLLQTASPLSSEHDLGFPARGWQEGYYGQIFWDELLAFPYYSLRFPEVAGALLRYRHRRLDAARDAACAAGYRGAMYPWRSARSGAEETPPKQYNPVSGHWMPDHTRLQRHVGAAIAFNLWNHHLATGDESLLFDYTADMLIEIARFWANLAERSADTGRYEIRGVIGPDEYHDAYPGAERPGLDNNAYTNVMAAWTLCRALELLERMPAGRRVALARRLELHEDEAAAWDDISRRLKVPLLDERVIVQFDRYDTLKPAAEAEALRLPGTRIDWSLEAQGQSVNDYQITKQADVLMLLHLLGPQELGALLTRLGYRLRPDWARATIDHYTTRISHESSLCYPVCAGALAAVDAEGSWSYYQQALQTDLGPGRNASTHEGLHLGAMAGTLDVLQRHYLGLVPADAGLQIVPCPPPALDDVEMTFRYRDQDFALALHGRYIEVRSADTNSQDIRVLHEGENRPLAPGRSLRLACR